MAAYQEAQYFAGPRRRTHRLQARRRGRSTPKATLPPRDQFRDHPLPPRHDGIVQHHNVLIRKCTFLLKCSLFKRRANSRFTENINWGSCLNTND